MLQQARGMCASLRYFSEYHMWANRALASSILQQDVEKSTKQPPALADNQCVAFDPTIIATTKCPCSFFSTIKGITSHIAIVDDLWYHRVINQPKYEYDAKYSDDHPAAMWDTVHGNYAEALKDLLSNDVVLFNHIKAMEASLKSQDESVALARAKHLLGPDGVQYSDTKGTLVVKQEAACLMHVFNHGTHHRGQIHATMSHLHASSLSPSPPALDMPMMGKSVEL